MIKVSKIKIKGTRNWNTVNWKKLNRELGGYKERFTNV